jgi:hypothetical protein
MPRIRMAYQNAAWQEARVAAEAGIDMAINDLVTYASGGSKGSWLGWQPEPPAPGAKTPPAGRLTQLATATGLRLLKIQGKLVTPPWRDSGARCHHFVTTFPIPVYTETAVALCSCG